MNTEKQNIAIALAVGFKRYNPVGLRTGDNREWNPPKDSEVFICEFGRLCGSLPNFLGDLNMMHEAFKRLGRHWKIEQVEDGYVVTVEFGRGNKDVVVAGLDLCHAMAEAFLRTFNIWEVEL